MKRWMLLFLLLAGGAVGLQAELSLFGEAKISASSLLTWPYNADRFKSLLNPGNLQGLRDVNLNTELTAKLEGGEEKAAFALWIGLEPYRLGQALLAAASGNDAQTTAVMETASLLSYRINTFQVLRAHITWTPADALLLRLGRQSMLTGYGYGWNPLDFANPLKDPREPEQELIGVEALGLQYVQGSLFTLKLSGIYRPGSFDQGVNYEDLQAAGELTLAFTALELKITGFYDHDDSSGEDAYVPALGGGCMIDISGLGLYGEAALLKGSRVLLPISEEALERKDGWLFSGLLGLEYTFSGELSAILEYFYNGEGYDWQDRRRYQAGLDNYGAAGSLPADYLMSYRPGYFSKHYLLLTLRQPIYALNTHLRLSGLYAPDSWALSLMPAIVYDASGSLTLELGYTGLFDLRRGQYNEAWLSPAKHMIKLEGRYNF